MVMSKNKQKNCTGFSFSPKFRHVTIVLHVGPLKFVTRGDFFSALSADTHEALYSF